MLKPLKPVLKSASNPTKIDEQEYFDHGILLVARIKAGVELAFETMVESGIIEESAYYESLHETPPIANTIARRKLSNVVISTPLNTATTCSSSRRCSLLREKFMRTSAIDVIGKGLKVKSNPVDNKLFNRSERRHPQSPC